MNKLSFQAVMQTAWILCIYTCIEFPKWDSSIQCHWLFLSQVSICSPLLSSGWSMPVPSLSHCSHWWGYFQLPVPTGSPVKTSLTEISAILKPVPAHGPIWSFLVLEGILPWMTGRISFMKSVAPSSCQNKKASASVQLPYLFDRKLTVTLIPRSSELRISAIVSSL